MHRRNLDLKLVLLQKTIIIDEFTFREGYRIDYPCFLEEAPCLEELHLGDAYLVGVDHLVAFLVEVHHLVMGHLDAFLVEAHHQASLGVVSSLD